MPLQHEAIRFPVHTLIYSSSWVLHFFSCSSAIHSSSSSSVVSLLRNSTEASGVFIVLLLLLLVSRIVVAGDCMSVVSCGWVDATNYPLSFYLWSEQGSSIKSPILPFIDRWRLLLQFLCRPLPCSVHMTRTNSGTCRWVGDTCVPVVVVGEVIIFITPTIVPWSFTGHALTVILGPPLPHLCDRNQ